MFSSGAGMGPLSSELDGVDGAYSCRLCSTPEKDGHLSRNSKADRTSDTSSSSYRTAPGSEEAECFKDCAECLDEAGYPIKPCTYCGSEYEHGSPAATPILPRAHSDPADGGKISRVAEGQLHGTLNAFGNVLEGDPCGANSPGKRDTNATTSGGVKAHFSPHGTEAALGGSLPFQEGRGPALQAVHEDGTIKDPTCRDQPCSGGGGRESQQVQMSVTAKNSPDLALSGRMGLGTRRLQPGDGGSKYLDHPTQQSPDKSKEMLPNPRKLKKSTLGGRTHGLVSSKPACPKYFVEKPSVLSDSDEADNEVEKLTALSFQSLSCPQGSYLDMYTSSNGTSSSLSNSLPGECNGINRWPACSDQRKTGLASHAKGSRPFPAAIQGPETELLGGVLGKEHFECIDVTLENTTDGKKSFSNKKRMVPKRQIQLRRKEKKEGGFCAAGDCAVLQPFAQPRKESCVKGRSISDEFRINYKQFLKAASLSNAYSKTRMASNLVKNVLAKKMQYEQRIKMEQASVQGSSTSSVPSSISTDLQGDSLEGKSSSLSKSDCSFSTEDMQSHSTTSERSEPAAVSKDERVDALRPTKGVVLNAQLREKVCKLKNTFNELNERMKSQEGTQLKRLPILAESGTNKTEASHPRKQASGERKEYRRARAVFESMEAEVKRPAVAPKFTKPQKPWPNLKQRAIRQNRSTQPKEETLALKPKSLWMPRDVPRNIFTSKTKEMKLIPQLKSEHNVLHAFKYNSVDRPFRERRLPTFQTMKLSSVKLPASGTSPSGEKPGTEETTQMESKGITRIHQPRGVRKLVNDPYSLAFKSSDSSSLDQASYSESKSDNSLTVIPKEPTSVSPLFIHCTSICRRDEAQTESHMPGEKQDQIGDIGVSTLSLHDENSSGRDSSDNSGHPTVQSPRNTSVHSPENKCSPLGESAVHITSIQSKKLVVDNKEFQPPLENKPVPCERSVLNVRPSSATKKESQLNIRVNSSLSKPSHKTETDFFPSSSCSTLDEGSGKEALPPTHHSWSQDSKDGASSETLLMPSSTYLPEVARRDRSCPITGHSQEFCKTQDAELPHQKQRLHESHPVAPRDSKGSSSFFREPNVLSESPTSCASCRHPQASRPPMTSTQSIQTQTAAPHYFLDGGSEMTAPESPKPLEGNRRTHPGCLTSDSPLTRGYTEGIKVISNSSFTPSTSCSKLHGSECDYPKNKHQVMNEQYFSAIQNDNTNYLTIPVKAHEPEAPAKSGMPLGAENPSFTSNVSFQSAGEALGNKVSNEFLPPKQMEKKEPSDHVVYGNPVHGQLPVRPEESPNVGRKPERTSSPTGKNAPSPTRAFAAPPLQGHRKMLVDPESGKCYYVESPRQPQLKMLYDPETGQYIEVLIPPVPLTSHSGLYHSPFSPVIMNAGGYVPSYMPYSSFQGFPPPPPPPPPPHLPPPPAAALPAHSDLHDQPPMAENANFSEGFSHFSKNEAPPAAQSADGNYMESLYYIPTGMNSSPNPNQALFSPPANPGPNVSERGSFVRM